MTGYDGDIIFFVAGRDLDSDETTVMTKYNASVKNVTLITHRTHSSTSHYQGVLLPLAICRI